MSGIMAAIAGNSQNTIYADGLFNTTTGVDLSPITASAVNTSITRTWIGYFLSESTATVSLGLQTTASAGSFGGSASTQALLWFGDTAVSGFVDGNANITSSGNQTVNVNFAMTQGVYYPVRIRWDGDYEDGFFGDDSDGSVTFLASGISNVSGKIFYNSLTNGF
jgi:hypothetical protein